MYMLTAYGGEADLSNITPRIDVIAAHLSKINRWNGATNRLYSVAEHSLHVCNVMERDHGIRNPLALLCGLMHDAHEAYIGDTCTPVRAEIDMFTAGTMTIWARGKQTQVLAHFNLVLVYLLWEEAVKRADLVVLATEARDLMEPSERQQSILRQHGHGSLQLALGDYDGMDWTDWRDAFVERFGELRAQAQEPEWRAA